MHGQSPTLHLRKRCVRKEITNIGKNKRESADYISDTREEDILASGLVKTGLLSTKGLTLFSKMEEAYGFR